MIASLLRALHEGRFACLAPLSSLEVYKEVFVDEDLVEVSENLMGALLVLFKG